MGSYCLTGIEFQFRKMKKWPFKEEERERNGYGYKR